MSELPYYNKRLNHQRDHDYAIHGSVFELRSKRAKRGANIRDVLYKRYFVSPEFVQLFYKVHEGDFDDGLFERLSDKERQILSQSVAYLGLTNKAYNIAQSKTLRNTYERLKLIEGAIKSGNLSNELHDEYVGIMETFRDLDLLPRLTASNNIKAIGRNLLKKISE